MRSNYYFLDIINNFVHHIGLYNIIDNLNFSLGINI